MNDTDIVKDKRNKYNIDINYKNKLYKFRNLDCRPRKYYLLPKNGNINKLHPVLLCLNQDKKLHYPQEEQEDD